MEDNNRSNVRNERGAALNEHSMRWIVDINLPQVRINNPDVLPLESLSGDLFLQAHITNRYIVSADFEKIIKKSTFTTSTLDKISVSDIKSNLLNYVS